ncbi:MAG: universal stress protein [Verrucomicrobiae bacterium]
MYPTILVTLDTTPTDRVILDHIKPLAQHFHSRVILLHVATSVPAQFLGPEAEDEEVREDQAYLNRIRAEFESAGLPCDAVLAYGEPVKEIVSWVQQNRPDLVAMSTHGHHFVADLVLGTTAIKVQHCVSVPVLLLRAK